jgi:hypothetical protein
MLATLLTLCPTLSGDPMCNRLSALICLAIILPTIRSALSGEVLYLTILCGLHCLVTLHSTIRCTMLVDITTDSPLCSVW